MMNKYSLKKNKKNFQKTLDRSNQLCYTTIVPREQNKRKKGKKMKANYEKWYTISVLKASKWGYKKVTVTAQKLQDLKEKAKQAGIPFNKEYITISWEDTTD